MSKHRHRDMPTRRRLLMPTHQINGHGKCAKFVLLCTNIKLLVVSLFLIGIAVWMIIDRYSIETFLGTKYGHLYDAAVYILCGCGSVGVLLSLIGWYGAVNEARCCLCVYLVVLCCFLITMICGGVIGFLLKSQVHDAIESEMKSSIAKYNVNTVIHDAWNLIQKTMKCCGVSSEKDWNNEIPTSCCFYGPDALGKSCNKEEKYFETGCLDQVVTYFSNNSVYIAIICSCVTIFMVVGLVSTCILKRNIQRHEDVARILRVYT